MGKLTEIYRTPLALLTDLYQLTMAYGYWKTGRAEQQAVFHLFFRKNPFAGGYTIAAGLQYAVDYLADFQFSDDDIEYLSGLTGNDGKPLFERGFLKYLGELELECDVDAVPEGTVVFPHQPLVRVKGPILQCQILETALLNLINYQSLIATEGSANFGRDGRRTGARVRAAPCPGYRRSIGCQPCGLYWRLRRDVQRIGWKTVWHPGQRNTRSQLGHVVRR